MNINTIFAESYLDSEIKKIGRVGAQSFLFLDESMYINTIFKDIIKNL